MSNRKFENSWSRLERAEHHARAFIAEWKSLLTEDSITTIARYDKDSGWFIVSSTPNAACIERINKNTFSLELGELAYQLRAALDGLIWDAITFTQGAEPPSDANRLEFPILNGKSRKFDECSFHNFPFPDDLKNWIESIQPDSADKPIDDPDRGLNNTLEDIHDLARLDRHRRLRIIAVAPTQVNFRIAAIPAAEITAYESIDGCDFLSGKYEFLRFRASTVAGNPPDKTRLETHVTVEISCEDVIPYEGEDIGFQLKRFVEAVQHVITRFEDQF